MIFALGLPLKVAAIILVCIFSTLFIVFNALGPISNPIPPTAVLIDGSLTDTTTVGQSGCWSNHNEGVINILQISRTWSLAIRCSLVS